MKKFTLVLQKQNGAFGTQQIARAVRWALTLRNELSRKLADSRLSIREILGLYDNARDAVGILQDFRDLVAEIRDLSATEYNVIVEEIQQWLSEQEVNMEAPMDWSLRTIELFVDVLSHFVEA